MFCINCFHVNTSVVNSRPQKKQPLVWRRRKCSHCGSTFTTEERPSLAHNVTVHLGSDALTKSETFNLGKLIISIAGSFSHAPDEAQYSSLWLAQTVEQQLSVEKQSITPDEIAVVAHHVLKKYDELAAVQYAAKHQLLTAIRRSGRPSLASRERGTGRSPSQSH